MSRKSTSASSSRLGTPKKNQRQSLSALVTPDPTARLYEAIIKDPRKKAMILQLLSQEKHLINDCIRKERKTPVNEAKKLYCESPTALFRRKLMEKQQERENDNSTSSGENSIVPSPVPFEKLLDGVIAFVEVKTKSGDRSSATKAVITSMGATVREKLTKDVTHLIFKDGSYNTYLKGKLIKAHIVSLLWIEAVRKNHVRVPEKDYPALGTEAFNANLSVLCQQMQEEYEEALQDEVNQTLNSSKTCSGNTRITRRITGVPSELFGGIGRNSSVKVSDSFNSQSRRQTMQHLSDENNSIFSSDSSDFGMIDGEITKNIINRLELSSPEITSKDASVMKSIENIEISKRSSTSDKTADISNNNNSTEDTSNGSTSLLDLKKLQSISEKNKESSKSKENKTVDMELTGNVGNMLKVTTARKLLPKVVEQPPKRKKGSSEQRLFTNSSTESSISELSTNVSEKLSINNESSSGETFSLRLSANTNSKTESSIEKIDNKNENNKKVSPPNRSSRRQSVRQKLFASQTTSSESCGSFPALKLSPETDRSIQKEINSIDFVTVRKEKRKILEQPETSPSKVNKPEKNSQNSATKRKRKLYNPDEELNGSNLREREDSTIINKKANITFKKPTIPLTPILLTTRAKTFLNEKKSKIDDKPKNKTTPPKSTQSKVVRNIKSTTKKPTATEKKDDAPKKRSSSFYFDNTPIKVTPRKLKTKASIVCTRLHKPDVEIFQQIVRKLGGFFIEDEVTKSTTHLVAGEAKRTINLLRALARGCWILKHEWLLKSLEAGKWLSEEDYELTEFSTAVQRCRIERQAFGPSYSMDIFRDSGYIYVARSTIPRCSDLQELIKICKGKVTTVPSRAKIVVGEQIDGDEVVCVRETWVLDSIAENKLKPIKNYLLDGDF